MALEKKAAEKADLDAFEEDIQKLKVAYERYFHGVDHMPPARDHETLKRQMRRMIGRPAASTQLRFRFNNLRARLTTYEQYWNRILNQIEKGTYKRVLAEQKRRERVARAAVMEIEPSGGATTIEGPADLESAAAEALAAVEQLAAAPASRPEPVAPPPPSTSPPPTTRAAPASERPKPRPRPSRPSSPRAPTARPQLPDGVDARTARALFKDFVQAKKQAGQSTDGLTYGALVKKLAREVPKLKEKRGEDAKIAFEVATVKGRVRLRAK